MMFVEQTKIEFSIDKTKNIISNAFFSNTHTYYINLWLTNVYLNIFHIQFTHVLLVSLSFRDLNYINRIESE